MPNEDQKNDTSSQKENNTTPEQNNLENKEDQNKENKNEPESLEVKEDIEYKETSYRWFVMISYFTKLRYGFMESKHVFLNIYDHISFRLYTRRLVSRFV